MSRAGTSCSTTLQAVCLSVCLWPGIKVGKVQRVGVSGSRRSVGGHGHSLGAQPCCASSTLSSFIWGLLWLCVPVKEHTWKTMDEEKARQEGEQIEGSAGSSVQGIWEGDRMLHRGTALKQNTSILASAALIGPHCSFTKAKRCHSTFVGSRQSWRHHSLGIWLHMRHTRISSPSFGVLFHWCLSRTGRVVYFWNKEMEFKDLYGAKWLQLYNLSFINCLKQWTSLFNGKGSVFQ